MLLYAVPVTPAARVAVARSSGGLSLTVDRGEVFGTTFPANLIIFRGNGVLTMLTATARVGKVLTISATLPENYADHALTRRRRRRPRADRGRTERRRARAPGRDRQRVARVPDELEHGRDAELDLPQLDERRREFLPDALPVRPGRQRHHGVLTK
jgi:hypothetical protein